MHIQAYLDIYHYSYNNINFLFFTLILYTFQRNLKVDLYDARSLIVSLK